MDFSHSPDEEVLMLYNRSLSEIQRLENILHSGAEDSSKVMRGMINKARLTMVAAFQEIEKRGLTQLIE